MTDQELNIEIARALGLERLAPFRRYNRKGKEDPNGVVWMYCSEDHGGAKTFDHIPNYAGDLNVITKEVSKLKWMDAGCFFDKLYLTVLSGINGNYQPINFLVVNASARHRAEAFLRIITTQ
jgi:hypothetical protein